MPDTKLLPESGEKLHKKFVLSTLFRHKKVEPPLSISPLAQVYRKNATGRQIGARSRNKQ